MSRWSSRQVPRLTFPIASKWVGDLSSGLLALLLTLWKDKHACAMCMCFARFLLKTTNEQVVSGVATYTLEGQTLHMSQVGRSPTFTGNCGMLLWACYKLCSKDYPLGRSGVFMFCFVHVFGLCLRLSLKHQGAAIIWGQLGSSAVGAWGTFEGVP